MIFEIPIEKFNTATSYKKRDCYSQLEEYINGDNTNVCTLYGLRRTGKSTMMFQAMNDIGLEHCGYILCEDGDNYGSLCQKLLQILLQINTNICYNQLKIKEMMACLICKSICKSFRKSAFKRGGKYHLTRCFSLGNARQLWNL